MFSRLLIVALALILAGCAPKTPSQTVRETLKSEAESAKERVEGLGGAVMKGGTLRGGDSKGRPLWSLGAKEIRTAGDLESGTPNKASLIEARATLYREGQPDSTFRADRIEMFKTASGVRLQMTGNVMASASGAWTKTDGPVKIAAPRADVDVARKIVAASGGVTVTQGELVVKGQTLRAASDLKTAQMKGEVRAQTPSGQIAAPVADWDWANHRVTATGGVSAQRENAVLKGEKLVADTSAGRGLLSGGVVVTAPQGNAKAPQIAFDWKKDRLDATGGAVLNKGDATLTARTLSSDTKLAQVKATSVIVKNGATTLRASNATANDKLSSVIGSDVKVEQNGWVLTAPRATATNLGDEKALKVVASGGVVGKSSDGEVRASRATWGNGKIVGEGGVTLVKDGARLAGARLESDQKFQNARFSGSVNGKMADGTTLTAPLLEKTGEKIVARRGASAQIPAKNAPSQLGALKVKADYFESQMSGDSAILKGNVLVTSAEGATLRAPIARYSRKTGKITASGGVLFRDPKRGLEQRGDSLVADLNLKEAVLTNVKGSGSQRLFEGKGLFD